MENISKALLIAGGILIGITIIALVTNTFNNMSIFQRTQLSEEEQKQLTAFNEKYTKYLNQYVYGIEVRNLMNKYESDKLVQVILEAGSAMPPTGVGQDTTYYKCTNIGYDGNGKVNSITFKQVTA